MVQDELDVAIVGGGIAGLTAALTCARLGWKTTAFVGELLGGQLLSIGKIDGYPGFPDGVPGYELCPIAQEQAVAAGAACEAVQVDRVEATGDRWRLTSAAGDYVARAVVLATGARLKELGVPGEGRLRGHGVSHCASCDAPLLRGKAVAVVGGGDSAAQEALALAEHAARVVLLHRGAALSAQAAYREALTAHPAIEVIYHTVLEEVLGDDRVGGIRTRNTQSGATADVDVDGVFIYVGLQPNAALVDGLVPLDRSGAVAVDAALRTPLAGMWAIGAVRSGFPGRAAAAAGDGASAALGVDASLRSETYEVTHG